MIKIGNGEIEVRGSDVTLLSELCILMRNLVNKNIFNKDDLLEAVRLACMSDEELDKEVVHTAEDMHNMWLDFMDELATKTRDDYKKRKQTGGTIRLV